MTKERIYEKTLFVINGFNVYIGNAVLCNESDIER